jgi:dienelactone hydrolase
MRGTVNAAVRAIVVMVSAAIVAIVLLPYFSGAAMILRAAGMGGPLGRLARWEARPVSDSIEQLPARDGSIRARIFRPLGRPRRAVLLVSGVHPDGIDEPRLVALAKDLAGTGVNVVTPEIRDLMEYRLTANVTNAIEDAALWTATREDLSGHARVGMIGVSFSGGLSIVAAGRPALRDRVAYVLSFGGHGNLPRVLHYLCTGVEPSVADRPGDRQTPHDYAVAVVLHQAADLMVPPEQVGVLRHGIETFLRASAVARTDQKLAADITQTARAIQGGLPEPSATLMKHVIDRDVASLGARLLPFLGQLGQDPSLSPDRSPAPTAPVYLLHGRDDHVIPPVESARLTSYLEPTTRVRRLESGFLSHVDVAEQPSFVEAWQMIAFWTAALGEQRTH